LQIHSFLWFTKREASVSLWIKKHRNRYKIEFAKAYKRNYYSIGRIECDPSLGTFRTTDLAMEQGRID
jgi:hypothetical protein